MDAKVPAHSGDAAGEIQDGSNVQRLTGVSELLEKRLCERVGYVQKLSSKGWVCRTWEGELAMTPVPGSAPQLFAFSVPDENVAQRIAQSQGKRVALRYEQKRGVPSSCFGETEYFVTEVRLVSP